MRRVDATRLKTEVFADIMRTFMAAGFPFTPAPAAPPPPPPPSQPSQPEPTPKPELAAAASVKAAAKPAAPATFVPPPPTLPPVRAVVHSDPATSTHTKLFAGDSYVCSGCVWVCFLCISIAHCVCSMTGMWRRMA